MLYWMWLTGISSAGPPTAAVEADDGLAPQPAAQLTALLSRLPDLSNRDAIDRVAVDFTFLNSKPARRRLVKVGRRMWTRVLLTLSTAFGSGAKKQTGSDTVLFETCCVSQSVYARHRSWTCRSSKLSG